MSRYAPGAVMLRAALRRMEPYTPGEQPRPGEQVLKLNTNENPYPPAPGVIRAIRRAAAADSLRRYPPPRADRLVQSASRLYGLPPQIILAGNGSDELLALLFRAALGPGDRVAYAVPTYSLYATLAAMQEAQVVAVPMAADFSLPVVRLAAARARLTIVCNPNSPSGTFTAIDEIDRLAARLGSRLLVVDEAYVDFAEADALGLVGRHANLAVVRSLSKSFSLAGMRVGLLFAAPVVVDALLKVKDSYNLSAPAIAAGAQALEEVGWMRRNVAKIKATRRMAEARLRRMGFAVPPSAANFVLARLAGHNLEGVARQLRRQGILVRHFADILPDALRISIGTPGQMARLFRALEPLMRRLGVSRVNGRAESCG